MAPSDNIVVFSILDAVTFSNRNAFIIYGNVGFGCGKKSHIYTKLLFNANVSTKVGK